LSRSTATSCTTPRIVYDTGITNRETGKNVRFVAPLSIAALEEAQRTGLVQISAPHRPMVDQAIRKRSSRAHEGTRA
jgi:hypothetical protein